MGILSGMDIERVQSDININFYINDVITNGVNGYVLPDEKLFKQVFSLPEVYASYSVLNVIKGGITDSRVSDDSRSFFVQKVKEFVNVWGNKSQAVIFNMLQIFCNLGESLYDVKDSIDISWVVEYYLTSSNGCFYYYSIYLYLCGVISKYQWLRTKQGFVGENPDTDFLEVGDRFYIYGGFHESVHVTLVSKVGTGDSVSKITFLNRETIGHTGYANLRLYPFSDSALPTWGAGSYMREITNSFILGNLINKNFNKLLDSKQREYLERNSSGDYEYVLDSEETKVYQPSAIEMSISADVAPINSPSYQSVFDLFSGYDDTAHGYRELGTETSYSSYQKYMLRDKGAIDYQPLLVDATGAKDTGDYTSTQTYYIPMAFDLNLPEWCL